jgi:hypothetical protein
MKQPSLRELARKYADGALEITDYRHARAELIQSILDADETVPPLTQANFTLSADDDNDNKTQTATARTLSSSRITRKLPPEPVTTPIKLGRDWRIPAGAGVSVLILIVISVVLLRSPGTPGEDATEAAEQADEPIPVISSGEPENQAVAMLREFTAAPRWDQTTLDAFVEEWQSLPAEQRETALESTAARRLADMLNRQLVEERALRGSDSETLQMIEERTLQFASDLGIQDRRLTNEKQ